MPDAFQAWDLEAKAAVMSGLGRDTLRPAAPNAGDMSEDFRELDDFGEWWATS